MANQLKMALIDTIHALQRRGWSQRRIASELGIDRATVARYLQQAATESNAAIAPIGSDDIPAESKPAIAPIGSTSVANVAVVPIVTVRGPGRLSDCAPWHAVIRAKLDAGLTAQRIYQDLVGDHGFTGSYYSVRRFVRRLEPALALPVRRLEVAPGAEAQIDFGTGAPLVMADGKRRHTHVFRIVLSHSRKAYSEAVTRQTTEDFIRCLENAFWAFGGAPQRLVIDNLKAAVTKADWFDPELNPKVQAFAQYYGVVFWPTRPYTPRHKGKVERGIDYVQDNALKGRCFVSLDEQNRFLQEWEQTVADTRLHGTTRQQVGHVFTTVERAALGPLPSARFPCFREGRRAVHRDGHVEIDRAFYSVPPEYVGRRVWVRWDSRLVRICNDRMEQIAVHPRHEPGRFSTHDQHIANQKISGIERGAAWLLGQVHRLGPHSSRWAEAVIANRDVEGIRVVQGLLSLARRHTADAIEKACDIALSYGAFRLRTVRTLIERHAPKQEEFSFTDTHALIRPLADYTHFVHAAFQKEVLA
ncbi:MAG TPA: IS21 family transposase [Gemmataceae bacterium]|nr:IS21 family transposase [Gemmataceae bacterium]